jgi:transcriptional regulator with XRE-family HTH domain
MCQQLKPLRQKDLAGTVTGVTTPQLSERVRLRIREEMQRQAMSQRDIAGILGWSQSRVAHLLTGHVVMGVDDLAAFGFALSLAVTELVRDRGMEFVAEMTPTELRLFERMRQLHPTVLDSLMTLLDVKRTTPAHERRAREPRKKKGN